MQHLDEGMIHAWLDGQLPPDEASAVEAHVAECRQCADAVAEARGLIAASSRILTALDAVPRDVAPKPITASDALPEGVLSLRREAPPNVESTPVQPPVEIPAKRVPRRWLTAPTLAAAAAVVVAVGMFSLYQQDGVPRTATTDLARSNSAGTDSAQVATPTAVAAPPSSQSLGAAGAANEVRSQVAPSPSPQGVRRQVADRPAVAAERFALADSAPRDERKVAEARAVDASKRKELASAVPAVPLADTSTVTVLRGTSVTPERMQAMQKASADRADAAAVGSIHGRVTDANKTAIVGAMVQVVGTNTAITTNAQGEYSLGGVQPGGRQLVVRSIGYQETKRDVSVVPGQTVSADVVVNPVTLNLEQVVVTSGSATLDRARSSRPTPSASNSPARGATAAPQPPVAQPAQASAAGCYEWTVTSTSAQQRTRFLQVPRRLALDTTVTPSSNDGIWYLARDLSRTPPLPNGVWRPIDAGVEVQWVVGSKTSTVRLTGSVDAVMRGTIEEIDRSAGTGESGNVISMRRPCEG